MSPGLARLVTESRLLLTAGPGGVGKTTLAACLGLQAVRRGRRTMVLTVDPAQRLADALGLGAVPPGRRITLSPARLGRAGLLAYAPLDMVMLDTGRSLAQALARQVPGRASQQQIAAHPFFQRMSEDLPGAREYAAMEEIHHLQSTGRYDLVVVDTPPADHALDFIDAPEKILQVLDRRAWRWLMRPALLAGQAGLRVLDFGSGYLVKTIARFTGMEFLRDLAGFINLFAGALEGLRRRSAELQQMLRAEHSALVLVCLPDAQPAEQALALGRRLAARGLAVETLVVNRVEAPPAAEFNRAAGDRLGARLAELGGVAPELARQTLAQAAQLLELQSRLAARDARRLQELQQRVGERLALEQIPRLDSDIHDLAGLEAMRRELFADKGAAGTGEEP